MTIQPYRYAKPHDPSSCRTCAPTCAGHHLCQHPSGCSDIATTQVKRHATREEYEALPERFKPIDGVAHQAVFACDEHGEDLEESFCEHAQPEPAPCPKCDATGTDPCLTKKGNPKAKHHQVRIEAQPPAPEPCRHAHREDCPIFEGCECTQDDPLPERPQRIVTPPPPPGPAPVHLPIHGELRALLEHHGVDVERILRAELIPNGDGTPTVNLTITMVVRQPNGDLSYDEHGYPRTETTVIELSMPRATDPVTPQMLHRPPHALPPGNDRNAATPLS